MHLTLAFLGEVSAEKQRALSAMAGRISQPGLRCILTMPGNGCALGWSGWGRGSPSRTATARQHAAAQAARSGCYQSPQPFHPHITLLRDAGQAVAIPPPGFHWSFQVNEFALYESAFVQGRTRYTPLQRWTLGDTLRNPDEV